MAAGPGTTSVRVLGPLEVRVDGASLGPRDFGGVKPKQVLEILVLARGRTVSKDEIADLLWGEKQPKNVARTLETYVSVLRSRLGRARGLIVTEPGGYRSDAGVAALDLDEFEALLRAGAAAEGEDRRLRLETALALVRGDLLADEPYGAWALDARVLFGERRVQALCDLAETCLSLGDHAAAVTRCEEALVLDPALERAHRVAMLAHYARGDEERALLAYERCRSALVEALGTTPTLQTAALHAAILRREDARSLTDGDAATVDTEHGPPTRYAHLGEVALAYQTIGDGPRDLVVIPGFVSHIEAAWEEPLYASFLRRLAQHQRVTVFDKRGTGLSDPVVDWPSFEERSEEVFAVMDAVGAERFVVLGVSEGAPLGAAAAAISPGRVAGLILYGSWLPHTWEPDLLALYSAGFEAAWTTGNGLQGVNPSRAHDRAYLRRFARYLRLSASPAAARRLLLMNAEIDVDPVLGAVATPTLVLHRRDERWVAIESGRYMADHIADARFVELPGVDHHPWVGDVEAVHAAVEGFIRELDAVGR